MPTLNDTDIVARAENKAAAEIGEETVILDITSGGYFKLNPTGARIWSLLDTPMSTAALCAKMADAFAVDPATCHAEVFAFVEQMQARGLATVAAA
jgi:predicted aspartyl protease